MLPRDSRPFSASPARIGRSSWRVLAAGCAAALGAVFTALPATATGTAVVPDAIDPLAAADPAAPEAPAAAAAAEPGVVPAAFTSREMATVEKVSASMPLALASLGGGLPGAFASSADRLVGYVGRSAWAMPIDHYEITARFNEEGHWSSGHHTGLDFAGAEGEPVKAARDGVVIESGDGLAWGNTVLIAHGGGITTRYAHLMEPSPTKVGQRVHSGEQIGLRGTTGNSTGPHLHFEVCRAPRPDEPQDQPIPIDPERVLPIPADKR